MLAFPAAIKIFVAIEPVDMRKQFNGLNSDMSSGPALPSFEGEAPLVGIISAFRWSRLELLSLAHYRWKCPVLCTGLARFTSPTMFGSSMSLSPPCGAAITRRRRLRVIDAVLSRRRGR